MNGAISSLLSFLMCFCFYIPSYVLLARIVTHTQVPSSTIYFGAYVCVLCVFAGVSVFVAGSDGVLTCRFRDCGASCAGEQELVTHVEAEHGDLFHICSTCGKTLVKRAT